MENSIKVGDKVIATREFNSLRTHFNNKVHTSVKAVDLSTGLFWLRGYSKYVFCIKTMKEIGMVGPYINVELTTNE